MQVEHSLKRKPEDILPSPYSKKDKHDEMEVVIPTSNRFAALSNQQEEAKKEHIPPLVLEGRLCDLKFNGTSIPVKDFVAKCNKVAKNKILIKSARRTTLLFTRSREEHTALREYLVVNNVLLHTFPFQGEKKRKWVLHGLPPSVEVGDIITELKEKIPEVETVIQMTRTDKDGKRTPLPTYIINTQSSVTISRFKNLIIFYHKVRVEKYISTNPVTQCYRCQLFGHSSKFCHLNIKCVRCAGNHPVSQCKRETTSIHCANCGEAHVASYRNCQARSTYLEKKTKSTVYAAPTPSAPKTTPVTTSSGISAGISYAQATKKSSPAPPDFLHDLKSLQKDIEELGLIQIISVIKEMISELKNATSGIDKIQIMLRYAERIP